VLPEVVFKDESGIHSLKYDLITNLGIGTIQEHMVIIEQLQNRLNTLKTIIQ